MIFWLRELSCSRAMTAVLSTRFRYPACPWSRFITSETQALATPDALDLLDNLLRFEPRERLTAKEALAHEYFATTAIEGGKPDSALSDSGFASM